MEEFIKLVLVARCKQLGSGILQTVKPIIIGTEIRGGLDISRKDNPLVDGIILLKMLGPFKYIHTILQKINMKTIDRMYIITSRFHMPKAKRISKSYAYQFSFIEV